MIIHTASLVKFHNEVEGCKSFAVILNFDEWGDRNNTSQAHRSYAYFPVTEETGRAAVRKYAGSEDYPNDLPGVYGGEAYSGDPHVLGKYDKIFCGKFNLFTKDVKFIEL